MNVALVFRHDVGWDLRYLIARITGAPVHVAVAFDETCIEASFKGVREIPLTARLATGQWTVVPVPCTHENAVTALRFARSQIGRKYDWLGVLWAWWFGKPAGDGMQDRWFCSELAAVILTIMHIDLHRPRAAWFTPRRLWDIVQPWVPR